MELDTHVIDWALSAGDQKKKKGFAHSGSKLASKEGATPTRKKDMMEGLTVLLKEKDKDKDKDRDKEREQPREKEKEKEKEGEMEAALYAILELEKLSFISFSVL